MAIRFRRSMTPWGGISSEHSPHSSKQPAAAPSGRSRPTRTPESPGAPLVRKPQLPHHRLEARLLAQWIEERLSLQTDQLWITQLQSGFQPLECFGRVAPLRVDCGVTVCTGAALSRLESCQRALSVSLAAELVVSQCEAVLEVVCEFPDARALAHRAHLFKVAERVVDQICHGRPPG